MKPGIAASMFLSLCTAALSAQATSPAPELGGTYILVNRDGGPAIKNAVTTIVIAPTAVPGVYASVVYANYGSGPVPVPGEAAVFVGSGGCYGWTNQRGTTGRVTYITGSNGEWVNEVLSGPNAGVVRRLLPCL